MRTIDWIVFALFLAYVVWDGMRRAVSSRDLEGYYAGGRKIPWWAAGLSIMATQASAITVIGTTGQGYEKGMDFIQIYFGLPLAMVLLCIFLVPLYRSRAILTPYEYLEERFGPLTRSLASLIFLLSRCLALGVVIYAPSVALSAMIGIETWLAVLLIGALTTLYTVVGGVSAVIWTDVKQMTVILGGLFFVLYILLRDLLPHFSFGEILDLSGAAGKLNALETEPQSTELMPRTLAEYDAKEGAKSFWEEKYNLLSGLFGGLFLHLSYFGCDHSQTQRLLTSKDTRQSRLSLLVSAFAKVPMQAMVLFIGVLIWMFYAVEGPRMLYKTEHIQAAQSEPHQAEIHALQLEFDRATAEQLAWMKELAALPNGPESDPVLLREYQSSIAEVSRLRGEARQLVTGSQNNKDTNDIFCRFILENLPPILLGLVIAAIFAAAMSSIDSTLNALSAATVVDFYRRWIRPDATERQSVRVGRVLTLLWGVVATLTALMFDGRGSVIELINQVGSLFYGSLLGVFALALFVRGAGARAGVIGLCSGMAVVLIVHNTLKIEFLWYNVIGCLAVVFAGALVALFERRGR